MFRIDKTSNRISKLETVSFADLGFGERQHLQEWLANQPDALGEDLLIIQKEFAGFDDTKERLDLLAIDKEGQLVVIENKLDDSGRDVVWQSLKYASYCSTLSKTAVARMFQQHLDRTGKSGDAQKLICEFLEEEDFQEARLNPGTNQRVILVSARFRKEVTSTVLWLSKHGINIKCFKATPYRHEDLLFLNLEQVIPLAEAEELMIGISEKEAEESSSERVDAARHTLRTDFWLKTLESLDRAGVDLYENVSPSRDHWLNAGSGLSGVHYSMIFSREEVRVEFVLAGSKTRNKALFDYLYERHDEIAARFGEPLVWRRNDDRKVSTIYCAMPADGYNREAWPNLIEWLVTHVPKLEAAFSPEIGNLRQLKAKTPREE